MSLAFCASNAIAGEVPVGAFTIDNATVGITTLTDIQGTYGRAEPQRVTQEDGADVRVCYSHSSPQGESFLVFESGVMAGFKEITGFRISTLRPKGDCVATPVEIENLRTGNRIRLGLSLAALKEAVPVEFKRRGSKYSYEGVTKRVASQEELQRLRARWPNEKQDYFDVTTTITAKFKENRLIDLHVHRIESY